MIRRYEDWPQRLDAAIAARARTPFHWGRGRHDCISAACRLIKAMTGADLADGFDWANRAEADALLAAHRGVGGIAAKVARRHRLQRIDVAFAQRGDAVVVRAALADGVAVNALGIVDLSGRFVLVPARVGWSRVPRKTATRAWRIEA